MNLILHRLRSSKGAQFVALSGAGWCLDFLLFYVALVYFFASPALANLIGSTTATMIVFLVSQRIIFDARYISFRSSAIYLIYTESNIVIWSLIISLVSLSIHDSTTATASWAAITAKVIVTPLSLVCNYLVSRWLSRSN